MIPFFDLKRQYNDLNEELSIASSRVFERGLFINGPEVQAFEKKFGSLINAQHIVGCASGTDALELALRAIGISRGDEVIVPAMTWISDAEVVYNLGAKPVFIDVDPSTYCIQPEAIDAKINDNTKAVIVVHLFGKLAEIEKIKSFCHNKNIQVIEDCAHAHGLSDHEQMAGTMGDMGVFSFYPTKNLGCFGDGGAVSTNNEEVAERVRLLSNHGQIEKDKHLVSGKTSRLDELQAAYLNVKITYLDSFNNRRKKIASYYHQELNEHVIFQEGENHVFHQCVIRTDKRDELKEYLFDHGIHTAIHYPLPIPATKPFFQADWKDKYPVSAKIAGESLSLPVFPELKDAEVELVVQKIRKFFTL